jgi:hypothetical protein
MNANDKYFCSVLFKLKVYKSDKQSYEDLFTQIMSLSNPDFRNPKPQGSLGDGKCDGFDKKTGKYYQVYAPEDLKSSKTPSKKFNDSLKTIIDEWKNISPVKEFYLVLNDKYDNGVYHSIESLISDLEQQYGIKCFPFLAKDLEVVFDSLEECKKCEIIGSIPNTDSLTNLISFDALKEAIEYIQNFDRAYVSSKLPENINIPLKITFNKLSQFIAELINIGSYQIGNIDDYFKQNSNHKVLLQKVFNNLYKEGLETIPDTENRNDLVFFYILENSCISKRKSIQDAVLVLMSYYFGYCDIFEEPPKTTLF